MVLPVRLHQAPSIADQHRFRRVAINVRQVLGATEQDADVARFCKIIVGVLAVGRFGLPSGDLWAFCGMPVFIRDWKRVQSQFLVVLKCCRYKYSSIQSFPFRCWWVGKTCQRPSHCSLSVHLLHCCSLFLIQQALDLYARNLDDPLSESLGRDDAVTHPPHTVATDTSSSFATCFVVMYLFVMLNPVAIYTRSDSDAPGAACELRCRCGHGWVAWHGKMFPFAETVSICVSISDPR